jgi:archaeal type IV pilus assembly protein PilA
MKANRKFVQETEAVSPVIAVILMVAITVVLAATVFVLVQDLGGQNTAAPAFTLQPNEAAGTLTVQSAAQNADWSRLEAKITQCAGTTGHTIKMGAAAGAVVNAGKSVAQANVVSGALVSSACPTTATAVAISGSAAKMVSGDTITFCVTNGSGAAGAAVTNAKVDIRDKNANQQVYTHTFASIAAC